MSSPETMPRNESGRPNGGFSFADVVPGVSGFPSPTTTTTTTERISGQASPKMLLVAQKNIQIKAEAAVTNILVNRWGPHMLDMFMKQCNSMPDQVKLLNDSQQLEQMMRSWIPGNNKKYFLSRLFPILLILLKHTFDTLISFSKYRLLYV